MTTERDARILAEHHEIAGGRIAEAARDASPVPAEPDTPAVAAIDPVEVVRLSSGEFAEAAFRRVRADALRWAARRLATRPVAGKLHGAVAWLTVWADELDAARSTDPGPAPDGIPVDRSGFEVTVVAAENIDRAVLDALTAAGWQPIHRHESRADAGPSPSPAALDLGRCWCCESATGAAPDAVNDAPIERVSTQEIEGSKG